MTKHKIELTKHDIFNAICNWVEENGDITVDEWYFDFVGKMDFDIGPKDVNPVLIITPEWPKD